MHNDGGNATVARVPDAVRNSPARYGGAGAEERLPTTMRSPRNLDLRCPGLLVPRTARRA